MRGGLSFVKSTRFLPNPSSTNTNHLRADRSTQENSTMTSRIFDADEYFGDPESQNVSIDPRGFRRLSGDERTRLIDVTGVIKGIDLGKQGAYGVFFAKGSSFNRCGLLPKDGPINDQASVTSQDLHKLSWPGVTENELTIHRHLSSMPPLWPSRLCRRTL